MTPRQFLEIAVSKFGKEFTYYTHPDVQVTAHQVGTPFKESWTNFLCETGAIQRSESIERYTELERTLSSLYCFELSMEEKSYVAFTEAQMAMPHDKLSEENYMVLCADIKKTLQRKEAIDVLTCLIVYSDLGKSPVTRALAKSFGIDSSLDTDDLMLEILTLDNEEIIKILPSFASLSPEAKDALRTAYPIMTACLGHLYFLEGGPKTLETIAKALQGIHPVKRKELLDLVFFAQFYDGVGSQGQLNMAGSVTCTNNFYQGYMLMRTTLHDLEKRLEASDDMEKSVAESLELYLLARANWLQLDPSKFHKKEDYEFVLRLACTIRIFDPDIAQITVDEFYKLEPHYQMLLADQLSFNSKNGLNSFARSPHYIATAAQNISRQAFSKKEIYKAIQQALSAEICLAMLIKEIVDNHPNVANNTKMPMSFGKLAFRASEPGFCQPEEFDATLARWAFPRPQPTSTIKNLVFDLDNVLIKMDATRSMVFRAFSELAKKSGKNLSPAEVGMIFNEQDTDEIMVAYHRGKISTLDFRKYIREKLGVNDISDEEFDQAFTASILADSVDVKQRLAYLEGLINKGYNIYLLSNNNEIHHIYIKCHYDGMHWGKYFFKQYYSHETGQYQSEIASFSEILRENQLKINETLFFSNVIKCVDAAWQYGIRARQFSAERPMSDIQLIIDAITKNENSDHEVNRIASLGFFAVAKFKKLLEPTNQLPVSSKSSYEHKLAK